MTKSVSELATESRVALREVLRVWLYPRADVLELILSCSVAGIGRESGWSCLQL